MKIVYLFLIINILSLSPKQSNNRIDKFNHYLKSLKQVNLPLTCHSVSVKFKEASPTFDKSGFDLFKYSGTSKPLGYILDGKYIIIIDISIGDSGLIPFFTRFDKQGNKIDSMAVFNLSSSGENFENVEKLIISKDKRFTVLDTCKKTTDNSNPSKHFVNETVQTTIGITIYHLSANGRFVNRKRRVTSVKTVYVIS